MKRTFSFESFAYLLAILIAAGLRLAALGRLPLSDAEAALALPALEIGRGLPTQVTTQSLYVLLTAAWFGVLGASNFLARLWPALAGVLLAGAPFLFRRWLGRPAAVLLAFWIALDPGLVAASRQASGLALAVTCLALAGGFALNRRVLAAGVFCGLALLSGPLLWPGVIGLLLSIWSVNGWRHIRIGQTPAEMRMERKPAAQSFLIALVLTLGLAGTLFLRAPSGLSAAAADLPAYLAGWSSPGKTWLFLPALALFFYELLALGLGVWGGLASGLFRKDPLDRFLMLWALLAFILLLIYPARTVTGLVWVLLPLLALAARQMVRVLAWKSEDILPALAQAVLAFVLVVFAWMNLVAWFTTVTGADPILRIAAILGAGVLLALTVLLMGMGWSWAAARRGLTWGLGMFLVFFTLSMTWRAAGLDPQPQVDMWRDDPVIVDAHLLAGSVHDLSMYNAGDPQLLEVVIAEVDSPALRWLLRDQRQVSVTQALSPDMQPPLVITPPRETVELTSSYRGQDFVWAQSVPWSLLHGTEWATWLAGKKALVESTQVMLWARTDLFAGETAQPAQIAP